MTLENQWLIIQYFLYPNCLLPCLEGHEVCVQQWVVHGGDELEKGSERRHPSLAVLSPTVCVALSITECPWDPISSF